MEDMKPVTRALQTLAAIESETRELILAETALGLPLQVWSGCNVIIPAALGRPINGRKWPYCKFRRGHAYALQRQSRRAFWSSAAPEVSTSELAGWCWARRTLMEKRVPSRWQRESMIRAARSIGAVRTRRIGREWLWRLRTP